MLFQIYGENAGFQLLGWALVFVGLIAANELARRSKKGGIFFFLALPAALTVYFIAIYAGAAMGAEWALNNPTYTHMNSWFHYAKLYAATAGCIGFMMLKYKWSIGKTQWFKVFLSSSSPSISSSPWAAILNPASAAQWPWLRPETAGGSPARTFGCTAAGGTG